MISTITEESDEARDIPSFTLGIVSFTLQVSFQGLRFLVLFQNLSIDRVFKLCFFFLLYYFPHLLFDPKFPKIPIWSS